MNYNLNQISGKTAQKVSNLASLRKLINIIGEERRNLIIAFAAILPLFYFSYIILGILEFINLMLA